ncbi:MAG TPA: enoyl-CoA hydratase-related protein [Solirubrobacteraceae bacterium]|nr:enoyl-CoA hydratase-related protein [Solirubrobacteraceae bacterium]
MGYSTLRVERRGDGVVLVTLDRPQVLNAMTYAMHEEIVDVLDRLRSDDTAGAVVITGAGRAFCAGNDLRQPPIAPEDRPRLASRIHQMVYGVLELDRPVIAAINGAAAGIGLALALAADITVAAEDAPLIDGQIRIGVASGEQSVLLWPLLCGMARAKHILLTGETITGAEAERIGLVTTARPAAEVLDHSLAIAARLAAGSRPAIAGTKRALNHWLLRMRPAFETSTALEMLGIGGPDSLEGRTALAEKRAPRFPSAELPLNA